MGHLDTSADRIQAAWSWHTHSARVVPWASRAWCNRVLPNPPLSSRRGSVLIVALILAAVIAISLTSYIKIASNSMKLADRSFYMNAALNLAEVGIEEAIHCYNQIDVVPTPASAWAGWTLNGTTATRTFTGFALGAGVSGTVRVYCSKYDPPVAGTLPVVVAKSTVVFARGEPALEKYMEITLRRRSLFTNGVVAQNNVTWAGVPTLDSWNSDPDNNPATTVAYSPGVRAANATVASVTGNINLGAGGNVYGYARTGASGSTTGGSVHDTGTTTHDPSRVTNDFVATFPAVTLPAPTTIYTITGTVPTSYPRAGDLPNTSDGIYYYTFASGTTITANTSIGGNTGTNKNKKVVFLMNNHQGSDAINLAGIKTITIAGGSALTVYTNGNINAVGNGLANGSPVGENPPSSLQIYGTTVAPSTQTIDVGGNGKLYAAIYAPEAILTMVGGGAHGGMYGAVVAKTVSFTGGADFHFDEALAKLSSTNPFGVSRWKELQSATERAVYAAELSF